MIYLLTILQGYDEDYPQFVLRGYEDDTLVSECPLTEAQYGYLSAVMYGDTQSWGDHGQFDQVVEERILDNYL